MPEAFNSFDYRSFINTIAETVKQFKQHKLIESNSSGPQPDFPFCTYTVTSPYLSITQDVVEDELFELVVSFTWHDDSSLDVLNLATGTTKYFRTDECIRELAKKNITVVRVYNNGQRDHFLTVDYERLAGFDVRFRVKDTFTDGTTETIEHVEI